jgi:hypothetical protein
MTDLPDRALRAKDLRISVGLAALLGVLLLLTSCAAGPNTAAGTGGDPSGFWPGLWHGIIVPVTFVISLFSDNVNMYEVNNNGNWYDFGFFFGLLIGLGGGSRASKRS